jgi:hypothetical protein
MATWGLLKILMKNSFVSLHYYQELYQRLQTLKLGSKSIETFHKEMEVTMMRANIVENARATKARFLSGLNSEIANVVKLYSYETLEEMVHMAIKVKRQLRRYAYLKETLFTNPISKTTTKFEGGHQNHYLEKNGKKIREK